MRNGETPIRSSEQCIGAHAEQSYGQGWIVKLDIDYATQIGHEKAFEIGARRLKNMLYATIMRASTLQMCNHAFHNRTASAMSAVQVNGILPRK